MPYVFGKQTVPVMWLWMILTGHNILNYIILMGVNNCTAMYVSASDYVFQYFLLNIFFIKLMLEKTIKNISF